MLEELTGRTLGKYELRERLGRGGMAEVYKAYHATLDRFVALKILHPFLGEDPEFKDRFEREARNVARLRHPNIVQVYDFEFDPRRELFYMVMEYIDGPTLRTRLMQMGFRGEVFPTSEAVRVTTAVGQALAYAHSRGMVHRDIKPANIMLDADERVVLTDFGIARIMHSPNVTASGAMVGTPAYMAPEQGLGQSGDHRSDVYSLGIVLYQMVTGTVPFDAETPVAIVLKHVNEPLPAPSIYAPDISPVLEHILYKALAKVPEDRYQSVQEFVTHLNDLDSGAGILEQIGAAATAVPDPVFQSGVVPRVLPIGPSGEDPAGITTQQFSQRRGCLHWSIALFLAFAAFLAGLYLSFSGLVSQYLGSLR